VIAEPRVRTRRSAARCARRSVREPSRSVDGSQLCDPGTARASGSDYGRVLPGSGRAAAAKTVLPSSGLPIRPGGSAAYEKSSAGPSDWARRLLLAPPWDGTLPYLDARVGLAAVVPKHTGIPGIAELLRGTAVRMSCSPSGRHRGRPLSRPFNDMRGVEEYKRPSPVSSPGAKTESIRRQNHRRGRLDPGKRFDGRTRPVTAEIEGRSCSCISCVTT